MINASFANRLHFTVLPLTLGLGAKWRGSTVTKVTRSALFGLTTLLSITAHAEPAVDQPDVDRSKFEIITTALGLERFTEYSAQRDALGIAWAGHFGMEASYYGLGESKFATRRGGTSDNLGGRANLKLAVDLFAPLNERARIYSRVGMYLWEVDVNYNRLSNELDTASGGNSRMVGVGAVYGMQPLRVGVELEQISAASFDNTDSHRRLLLNMFSNF